MSSPNRGNNKEKKKKGPFSSRFLLHHLKEGGKKNQRTFTLKKVRNPDRELLYKGRKAPTKRLNLHIPIHTE